MFAEESNAELNIANGTLELVEIGQNCGIILIRNSIFWLEIWN